MCSIHPARHSARTGAVFCLRRKWLVSVLGLVAGLSLMAGRAEAELQFDIFVGYDGIVRESGWFPISVEVFNDGPTFDAVMEVASGGFSEQVRLVPIELPNNTRKRLTIPIFAVSSGPQRWSVRLLDTRGKELALRTSEPKPVKSEGFILGAVPRSFSGKPVLPEGNPRNQELKPQVAHLPVEVFPDNPIALEGLNAVYLNTEKAIALKVNQVGALLAWVNGGGHLILGVEQVTDINATPWLQELLPCELNDTANLLIDAAVQDWLSRDVPEVNVPAPPTRPGRRAQAPSANPYNSLGRDAAFTEARMAVAVGKLRSGARAALSADARPLVIEGRHGRGRVTVLTFSPEREPFRSWKNRPWFWARLADVPSDLAAGNDLTAFGGVSIDSVFGALIDSRQVRKLPVEWLLALLVVYLVVIGPFDQWWLKKINRQMLTWITFPTYVVLFSLLIYFIGYKLRAGETEWNELQVVDVMPRGEKADLRGRTFISIYSSANATYPLASEQPFATFRSELMDFYGSGRESSKAQVEQRGNSFRAQISVPVWTSLLYVNDWFEPAPLTPLRARLAQQNGALELVVENFQNRDLSDARLAYRGQVYEVGSIPANEQKTLRIDPASGVPLATFMQSNAAHFGEAVQARRRQFGDNRRGQLENPSLVSTVASFVSQIPKPDQRGFVAPAGMDLSPLLEQGDAVLLAWDANQSLAKPINQFKPVRTSRNTLLRLAVPMSGTGAKL